MQKYKVNMIPINEPHDSSKAILEAMAKENGQHWRNKMAVAGSQLAFQMKIYGPPMALYRHICRVYVQRQYDSI